MGGHGEKLTRKAEAAVSALLAHDTVAGAARASGVSEATLWRWMQRSDFQQQYRAARRQLVERAIGELQAAAGEAVTALRRNLSCGNPAVEVRCAQTILEQSVKAVELIDMQERLEHLEEALNQRAASRTGRA
jgi:DNA-binding MurR/RpiR family transcriptional regulator